MLSDAEVQHIVDVVAARLRPSHILVIGSYAKGRASPRSDLDLLVIRETDLPMERRLDEAGSLTSRWTVPVDVHVYTPEEVAAYADDPYSFIHTALTTGRLAFGAPLRSPP